MWSAGCAFGPGPCFPAGLTGAPPSSRSTTHLCRSINECDQKRTSGVDWAQAANIGKSLLLSPLVGFVLAALLLLLAKALIPDERLYRAPEGAEPPPFWIRGLLLLTCTGVSFAHGSNDGQKGMGLIMLILIGVVPTAYALNHAVSAKDTQDFIAVSRATVQVFDRYVSPTAIVGDPRDDVTDYVRTREFKPNTMLALRQLV